MQALTPERPLHATRVNCSACLPSPLGRIHQQPWRWPREQRLATGHGATVILPHQKQQRHSASSMRSSESSMASTSTTSFDGTAPLTNSSSSSSSSSTSMDATCSDGSDGEGYGAASAGRRSGTASILSWPGSGLYFFWQLGAIKYLLQHYDLTKVPMVGASGGALAAVLAACRIPPEDAVRRAYDLSVDAGIWDRPTALLGIWGDLIERWLDQLLPPDAAELCRGRVTIVVTTLPRLNQVGITDFVDRKDLINTCMASAHVPFFLDFKMARECRGQACVDGQLPDFFTGNCDLLTCQGRAVVFDYFDDPAIQRQGRMDMLQLKSYEEIVARLDVGYQFAKKLHDQGDLAGLPAEAALTAHVAPSA